ncbi:type III-B CRISPR module RAMP protein Cmr1 [Sorangium sp. So ce1153]|uniref:type III-B CRISPR module RAMP protein Cmr1 n=1 Tax=Sorangium sp. So ce1153 TaxID=3133333 RepID=UPI003F5F37D4
MRKGPGRAPSVVPKERATPEIIDEVRTYEFLTPVFGGGVKVEGQHKRADPVTPVRAASIRGQLRFWWRACNPRGCRGVEELRAAEDKVFGSTAEPSRLTVEVVEQPANYAPMEVLAGKFDAAPGMEEIAYGAFPLRVEARSGAGGTHGVLHRFSGPWQVRLRYPSGAHDDMAAALWAFAHLGGLGGRTRRGFGAVVEVHPATASKSSIEDGWASHVRGLQVPWPHLPAWREAARALVVRREPHWQNGLAAQKFLLGKLRALRQGGLGRRGGGTRKAGRSFWPEPDEIRRLTGRAHPAHRPEHPVHAFPRAAFGLPIIFQFKGEQDGEPAPTTLVPRGHTRWASPLVLRPHRGPAGIEAIALVLEPRVPDEVELRGKRERDRWQVKRALSAEDARKTSPPMGAKAIDPLQRFLEFFNE